jgi:endonuclease YncB( thermonuclease family)
MSSKKILVIILAVALAICICGLCIGVSLFAASPFSSFGAKAKIAHYLTKTSSPAKPLLSTTYTQLPTIEISSTSSTPPVSTYPIEGISTEEGAPLPSSSETPVFEPTLLYAASSTAGPVALDSWCVPWNTTSESALVQGVIDGVTIEVELDGITQPVRYAGIEMPDYSQDPGIWNASRERNRELVEGKTILLIKDRSDVDGEGRLLRYVLAGSVFVNRQLVESGYAVAVSSPPDISCDLIFQEAEKLARAAGRGLWSSTSTPSRTIPTLTPTPSGAGDLIIVKISPTGTAWQEPEEYVEIFNDGAQSVQLKDWTIRDTKGHVFAFPNFILGPQQYCRVYTDLYLPEHCGFTYYSLSPIWENDGDCAYLKDGDGILIDMYCYD